MTYFVNLGYYLIGFFRLGGVVYKDNWNAWKFLPLYATDYFVNVLTGGALESISRRAERHRSGAGWDKLLDIIEHLDPGHGANAGYALWGREEESPEWVQILTGAVFFALVGAGIRWIFV